MQLISDMAEDAILLRWMWNLHIVCCLYTTQIGICLDVIEGLIFIDTYMPFGGRSSGYIWKRYAQAMQWSLQHKYDIPPTSRWVDDFLFVLDPVNSSQLLMKADEAFNELDVPMDANKGEDPCLVYIGYTLNTVTMTIGTSLKQREKVIALRSMKHVADPYHWLI